MLFWVLVAIIMLLLSGCSPLYLVNTLSTESDSVTIVHQHYGKEQRQQLDIFMPERIVTGSPVIVFFYGGSWKRGEKGKYGFVGHSLGSKGYVTVIPDYRLYPEVTFPAFVEDGANVIAWVRQHVEQARNGVVVMGHSAGAHTAALLALDQRYLQGNRTTLQHYSRDDWFGRTIWIQPHEIQEHPADICRRRSHRKRHAGYFCLFGKDTASIVSWCGRQCRNP
jgi:pimeloyl-ACP methyl ester carboxylesterase